MMMIYWLYTNDYFYQQNKLKVCW